MSVTVTANKTVSFRSPYAGETFQRLAEKILGRDGYLGGGVTADNGSTITATPFSMVQFGIVGESLQAVAGLAVPTEAEPWFLMASLVDDDPNSGIVVSVTRDLTTAANGVIVAFKINGSWQNPRPVDVRSAAQNAAEVGLEDGFATELTVDGGGLLTAAAAEVGRVVDPDATRRDVKPEAGESAKAADATPPTPHALFPRNDLLVLRQRESFSAELAVLRGPTLIGSSTGVRTVLTASGTATRPSFYGRPGGTTDQQWWAWGDGLDLHILGGPAGGAFTDTILLSSSTITGTWLVGQRASDDAVLLLYLDGVALRLVSFNPTTGAQIDAPVTIDTETNALLRPRGVLDAAEQLHVVYEHDEGTEQQIYYTKVLTSTPSFGTAAVVPRIVAGANTSKNDTWPSVGVDRYGTAHIAYITGTGSNEFGDLAYAQIDNAGTLVGGAVSTSLVGSAAGVDDGTGFVNDIYDDFRQASIVVTVHDEVYAAVLGSPNGGTGVDSVLLFSPSFQERLGYDLIVLGSQTFGDYVVCAATSNDHGSLHIATAATIGPLYAGNFWTLDTRVAPNGRLQGTTLFIETTLPGDSITPADHDWVVALGSGGDVVTCYHSGAAGLAERYPALRGGSNPSAYRPHPNDVVLKTFRVAENASGDIPVSDGVFESTFEVFNVRPKRMNYPVLVGNDGDYQGYDALERAIAAANRFGGDIVLRAGRHVLLGLVQISSSLTIRGDGMAYIDAASAPGATNKAFKIGTTVTFSPTITGNKIEITLTSTPIFVKPGDFVELGGGGGTGFHRVAQVLTNTPTSLVMVVDDAYGATTGTAPAGTTLAHYPTGVRLENLCINAGVSAAGSEFTIDVVRSYQAVLRNLAFVGSHTSTLATPGAPIAFTTKSIMPLVEQIDFSQFNAPDDHFAIDFGASAGVVESPMVRYCRMRDGGPAIMIRAACEYPQLEFIHGDGGDVAAQHIEVEAGRTTPIYVVNCEGRFAGAAGDLAFITTNVGRRVRVPEIDTAGDTTALELEDANTRAAAGISDDAIKLTDASNQEFDGATKDVITAAVNERVLVAGDTMTGDLVMAANIVTNAAANRNLGADALLERFALYGYRSKFVGISQSNPVVDVEAGLNNSPLIRWAGRDGLPRELAGPFGQIDPIGWRAKVDFGAEDSGTSLPPQISIVTTGSGGSQSYGGGADLGHMIALTTSGSTPASVGVWMNKGSVEVNMARLPWMRCKAATDNTDETKLQFGMAGLLYFEFDEFNNGDAFGRIYARDADTSVNLQVTTADELSPLTFETWYLAILSSTQFFWGWLNASGQGFADYGVVTLAGGTGNFIPTNAQVYVDVHNVFGAAKNGWVQHLECGESEYQQDAP